MFCALLALAILAAAALRGEGAAALALGFGVPLAVAVFFAGVVGLAAGSGAASLPLPLGPPGLGGALLLDPLGRAFFLPLGLAAASAFAAAEPAGAARLLASTGAALLTLVAGDAFLLAAGAGLAILLAGSTSRATLAIPVLAAVACLAPHAGLLQGDAFVDLRAARRPGAGAGAALVFPAGIALSLLLIWPARAAEPAEDTGCAILRDAVLPLLGLFLLFRLLFDLAGPPAPLPAGLLLLGGGTAGALLAGVDALVAPDLDRFASGLGGATGMAGVAFAGLALLARALDMPEAAASGIDAALLAAVTLAVARPMLSLGAASVREQAGSLRLASLGGLAAPMPRTALLFLLAVAAFAFLPPLAGFSAFWLAAQTLLAEAHGGGEPGLPVLLSVLLAALGLAAACTAVAALRALAVAFGGRPRTPRGAAATETRSLLLRPMAALGTILVLVSVLPGALLRLLAPLVRALGGGNGGAPWLALASPIGGAVFSPALLVLVLAVLAALPWVLRRRLRVPPVREVAAWNGGAAPPPDWLPFGEPQAQPGAEIFTRGLPMLPRLLSPRVPSASGRLVVRAFFRVRGSWRRFGLPGACRARHLPVAEPGAFMPAALVAAVAVLLAATEAGWL